MAFPNKAPLAIETFTFSTALDALPVGVTITGTTPWFIQSIPITSEPIPALVIQGAPSVSGAFLMQQLASGTDGMWYLIGTYYLTSDGQKIPKYDCVLVKAPGC